MSMIITDPYTNEFRAATRLLNEWKKHNSIVIGVDFDGTMYDCHRENFSFPCLIQTIKRAQSLGAKLCVWTANADKELVERTWNELGLAYDYYNESPVKIHDNQVKPYFNLLLDDRAGLESALTILIRAMSTYDSYIIKEKKTMTPTQPALSIDFYKADHRSQYQPRTELVYSNFTPRSAKLFNASRYFDGKVVVFGLQIFIKDYLIREWNEQFFNQPMNVVVPRYKRFMDSTLGPDAISVDHIEALHVLGYLPILIRALPEGIRSPIGVPVLTIENTLPEFFWLTNYLESVMSSEIWKPMTYATIAYEYRRTFEHYADLTGASKDLIPFQLHDFSFRGASCREESLKSGIGFLTSSYGTDSCLSIVGAETWYNADITKELVGTSVPATEHATMVSNITFIKEQLDTNGRWEFATKTGTAFLDIADLQYDETHTDLQRLAEIAYIWYLVTELYPTGIVSIVSDSYDFWYLMEYGIKVLKPAIEARQPNALGLAKVVFRPDSGNPVDIICGSAYSEVPVEQKGAMACLYDVFGYTTNGQGYRHLNPKVGLIYGDSITLERQEAILRRLADDKCATDCVVLGVGSYSLCMNSRDTLGFAMKATYTEINGQGYEIYKEPKTGDGTKTSAKGLLVVENTLFGPALFDQSSRYAINKPSNLLQPTFQDGKLLRETSLSEIRALLHP